MASGGPGIPDIYNCAVCFEHLQDRNPRFLSCFHYFCETCLQKLVKNNTITCPSCREVTKLSNNDVTSLKINYLLVQMLERELHFGPKEFPNCKLCEIISAECKCKECGQLFCGSCRTKHDQLKNFEGHTILTLCEKHANASTYTCMKCWKEICDQCIILEHCDHEDEVVNYQEGIKKMKYDLGKLDIKLKNNITNLKSETQQLNTERKQICMRINKLEEQNDQLIKQIEMNMKEIKAFQESDEKNKKICSVLQTQQTECASLSDLISETKKAEGSIMQQYMQIQEAASLIQSVIQSVAPESVKETCWQQTGWSCTYCNRDICISCQKKCQSVGHNMKWKDSDSFCVGPEGMFCKAESPGRFQKR